LSTDQRSNSARWRAIVERYDLDLDVDDHRLASLK